MNSSNQKGVVLIVSLIFLVLITLLSVSSMKNTVLEEKMAGNYKDRNSAFQAAEAALRAGEAYLFTTAVLPLFDGNTTGLYPPTSTDLPRWNETVTDWSDTGKVITYTSALTDISASPKYIIEEMPAVTSEGDDIEGGVAENTSYYRITSQATGNTSNSVVWLQSTYKRNR